jgi:hypothetical protein
LHGFRLQIALPDPVKAAFEIERLVARPQLLEDMQPLGGAVVAKAGNVGGELLNWIAMLGAIGNRRPTFVAPQLQNGHAYGVWRWN